jgi:hypothetical protein
LWQQKSEFEALGVRVVVVTFEAGPLALAYVQNADMQWPLLIDESRALYAAYGMRRGRWQDIFGWSSLWIYAKLLFRGRRLRRRSGDVYQLGGDVLVDPSGLVRLRHVGIGPADRPAVSALLKFIRDAQA